MNKIIQANLAGYAIAIDEQAFELLKNYLMSLENYFREKSDSEDVAKDIEARIAELFLAKVKKQHSFINEQDVKEAIETIGSPASFADSEQAPNTELVTTPSSKKLFRDPDDKLLGGVCAGLAAFFGLDSVVVRLITALGIFAGGISIFVYIILWVIIPIAKTPQDKFRMRGAAPDLNEIIEKVTKETKDVVEQVKKTWNN